MGKALVGRSSVLAICGALLLSSTAGVLAQSVLSKAERTSESMEPTLAFPDQQQAAQAKLDPASATGKRPNIVWIVVDDMGNGLSLVLTGGGAAIGAATPNIDRLAAEGLKLTSTYSQPTCTPTRSAISHRPSSGADRPRVAYPRRRHDNQEPVGRRNLAAKTSGRSPGYRTVPSPVDGMSARRKGMRPHDIGFDEFYGFYEAEKEISQSVDKRNTSRPGVQPRAPEDAAQDRVERLARWMASKEARHPTSSRSTASRRWPKATA